jgi:SAM-dependent methyltransferase
MPAKKNGNRLFADLERIHARPKPFSVYTARDLWTDPHTSARMLAFHLDENVDISSRKGVFIDRSVDWMAEHFGIGAGKRVVDFGCGPGLYTRRLAQRGAAVTGIDFSARSIAYAQEQAEGAGWDIRYLRQDYLAFRTKETFDLVLMIMCDFCALSPAQRKILLRKFRSLLKPGGRIVLDAYSLTAFGKKTESAGSERSDGNGFWSSGPYYQFLATFKYEKEKATVDKYVIVERTKTKTVYNWLQYFSVDAITDEFRKAGLAVGEVFGDVAGKPFDPEADEFAVAAGRSGE